MFAFDNSYARLPDRFYRVAKPASAREPQLIRVNRTLAAELGIRLEDADDARLAQVFSGQILPVGAEPIAQA